MLELSRGMMTASARRDLIPSSDDAAHTGLVLEGLLSRVLGRPNCAQDMQNPSTSGPGTNESALERTEPSGRAKSRVTAQRAALTSNWQRTGTHQNFLPVCFTTPVACTVTVLPLDTAGPAPGFTTSYVVAYPGSAGIFCSLLVQQKWVKKRKGHGGEEGRAGLSRAQCSGGGAVTRVASALI